MYDVARQFNTTPFDVKYRWSIDDFFEAVAYLENMIDKNQKNDNDEKIFKMAKEHNKKRKNKAKQNKLNNDKN